MTINFLWLTSALVCGQALTFGRGISPTYWTGAEQHTLAVGSYIIHWEHRKSLEKFVIPKKNVLTSCNFLQSDPLTINNILILSLVCAGLWTVLLANLIGYIFFSSTFSWNTPQKILLCLGLLKTKYFVSTAASCCFLLQREIRFVTRTCIQVMKIIFL